MIKWFVLWVKWQNVCAKMLSPLCRFRHYFAGKLGKLNNYKYFCINKRSVVTMNIKHLLHILLLSCLLLACQNAGETKRSEADSQALIAIDDSIDKQSAYSKKLIEQGMRMAADSLSYYEYMARLGKYYCLSATPDSMPLYINKVIAYARPLPKAPRRNGLLAYAYNCQANHFHNFHKSEDEVVTLYHEAYQLLLNSDATDQAPAVCANLGDAYIFKNQLPQAASWYRRALFLADSLRLPKEESVSLYLGLGRIYLLLDDYSSSLRYYQQTEKHYKEMPLNMQAYFLNNYGNYYYYSKDYPTALKKFLELKQLLEANKLEETFSMYLCKLNLSDVYLNLGNVSESEKYLDQAEPYMRKNADETAVYYCNTIRIGQAVKKGDMASIPAILKNEKLSGTMDFSLRKIRNLYLRQYYIANGEYQKAYQNLKTDGEQNDSLEHNRINMRAAEIMNRFEQDTLRLHHSIAMEHKNAEIQASRWLIFAIVGAIVILGLLISLYVVHAHRKFERAKLNIIQLKLNNVRNRISPHFIFNVLNNKIINSDKQEADELLALTKLIRANLDMSCHLEVTLREELDFVKKYVAVERQLVGEDFEFHLDVDESIELDQVRIPSMFVQILAENAFVHGLTGWEGHKSLAIKVLAKWDDGIVITVTDNGPGFDARSLSGKQRTGLNVIRQTISVFNEHHKGKIIFQMHNLKDEEGKVLGCEANLLMTKKNKV